MSKDALEYWQKFFVRLIATPSWKKYVDDNQLESNYIGGGEIDRFLDRNINQLRTLLKEAGANVVR